MISRLAVKTHSAGLFHKSGGFSVLSRLTGKEKGFVLMYHRVLDEPPQESVFVQPGMYVQTVTFRRHVEYLRLQFYILDLSELIGRIESGKSVDKCCSITFDDGWRDTYLQAYPVLLEYGIPASIFLATGFIGTDRIFWPEEFSFYLRQPEMLEAVREKSQVLGRIIDEKSGDGKERLLDECISALKVFSAGEREELLVYLRSHCDAPLSERLLVTWEEAQQMHASGLVSFGAHTANHVILDQVRLEEAEQEIAQSRVDIEKQLGVRPDLFAYPNGNYTSEIRDIVKKQGFKGAVTTKKGWVNPGTDMHEIPRIGMHEDVSRTIPLFLARMYLRRF